MAKQVYKRGSEEPRQATNRNRDERNYQDRYEESAPRKSRKTSAAPKKKKGRGLIVAVLLLIVIGIGVAFGYISSQDEIAGKNVALSGTAEIVIAEGNSTEAIAKQLEEKGIIGSALVFRGYYSLNKDNYENGIQLGTFTFEAGAEKFDYNSIITKLSTPPPPPVVQDTITVTFPEYRSAIRFAKIAAEAFGDRFTWNEFLEVANDMDRFIDIPFIARLKEEGHIDDPNIAMQAEGFMAPNTYEFYTDASIEDIVRVLYEQFDKQMSDAHYQRMEELGISLRQAITLASIIESEASGSPEQQGKVSGVFWNRLQPNSGYDNLGSEMTFIYIKEVLTVWYGLEQDQWRQIPVNVLDAYHTEESNKDAAKGIPVGPYGAPSATAIDAALNPESHSYYFFVTSLYGEFFYAETYEQHLANDAHRLEEDKKYKAENG